MAEKGNKNAEKKIDWQRVDDLLKIGCNQEEIASVIGVDGDTLTNHCKREKGMLFSEYIKRGLGEYKIGIRRAQLRSAIGEPRYAPDGTRIGWITQPSVSMQIWLGKQHLDQKDKLETDNHHDGEMIQGFNLVIEKQ